MNDNIITAVFGALRETKVRPRYRYDHGQVLVVKGVPNLPDFFEVHFANEGDSADATPLIGTPDGVTIPDSYFQSGKTVLAYIYVHDEATDGTTVYKVTIPIINRARPANIDPDPEQADIIAQAIVALNENVGKAEIAADAAEAAQGAAETAQTAAETARVTTEGYMQAVLSSASQAAQSASDAATSAQSASESESVVRTYAGQADQSASAAATSESHAATSESNAAISAQTAAIKAEEASASAASAADSATAAAGSASQAATKASEASASATAAAGSATNASSSAAAASTSKEQAAASAIAANTAKTAAEAAQQGAENAAESVESSAAQISKNKQDIADLRSAFEDIAMTAGIAIIGSGTASNGNLAITADGQTVTLTGSNGASSFFEIDGGVDKLSAMTAALNRTHVKANHTYHFEVKPISGSYTKIVNFVIGDGASSSLYDIPGTGGSIDFSFDTDKDISVICYVQFAAVVSDLVVGVSLVDITLENTVNDTSIKVENLAGFFPETKIENPYASGQTNVVTGNRYFPDNIIPARSMLNEVTVYIGTSSASAFVVFEVWELSDDGTLTRISTKTVNAPTANKDLTFTVNTFFDKRRMISFCKSGCYIYSSNESVAGNGLYYTTDADSETLTVADLTSRHAQKLTYSMTYTSTDQTKIVKPYGELVTASNYADILPDLDNADWNVIYDIYNCLHSINGVPSAIDTTLNSATFYSFKGDDTNSRNWIVQYLIPNGSSTRVFVRNFMDSVWKPWIELGASEPDANLLSLDYYNATAVNKLEIGSIQGKNVLTFGDSITAGNTETSWTYHFAAMTGSTVVNKAVPGSSFGESMAASAEKYISTQLSGTTEAQWQAADLIIVSGGTNDGLINTPHDELKAKVQSIIDTIKANTDKPIVFITPIRRNTPAYAENLKLPLIAGIIGNVALMNQCNVICGYTFPIPSQTIDQITNVTRDGLHPNAIGANIYARAVINALT